MHAFRLDPRRTRLSDLCRLRKSAAFAPTHLSMLHSTQTPCKQKNPSVNFHDGLSLKHAADQKELNLSLHQQSKRKTKTIDSQCHNVQAHGYLHVPIRLQIFDESAWRRAPPLPPRRHPFCSKARPWSWERGRAKPLLRRRIDLQEEREEQRNSRVNLNDRTGCHGNLNARTGQRQV